MQKHKLPAILVTIGILLVVLSLAAVRFFTISDTLRGFFTGLGFGLLLLSLFMNLKLRPQKS